MSPARIFFSSMYGHRMIGARMVNFDQHNETKIMESRLPSPGAFPPPDGARGRWHGMPREIRDPFDELRFSSTGLLFTGGTDTSRLLRCPQVPWIVGIPQSNNSCDRSTSGVHTVRRLYPKRITRVPLCTLGVAHRYFLYARSGRSDPPPEVLGV